MFDLDKEVDAWCRSVHPFGFNRKARVEELKDHLYSAIERYQDDGLSEKEAFLQAIGRMGDVGDLVQEHSKNGTLLSTAANRIRDFESRQLDKWGIDMSAKKAGILNIVTALIFAAAILLASYFLDEDSSQTMMFILIAIWFIPFSFLSAIGARKQEKRAC